MSWDLRVYSRNESSELLAAANDLDIWIKILIKYCIIKVSFLKVYLSSQAKGKMMGLRNENNRACLRPTSSNQKEICVAISFKTVTVFCCVTYHGSLVPVWVPFPTLHPDFLSLVPKRILVWSQGRWGHIVCTLWWQDATAQPVLLCPLVFRAHNVGLCLICVRRQKGNMLPQVREQCCVLVWGGHPVSAAKR